MRQPSEKTFPLVAPQTAEPESFGASNLENDYPEFEINTLSDTDTSAVADEESILRRAALELVERKAEARAAALLQLDANNESNCSEIVAEALDDNSAAVRSAAIRALFRVLPQLAISFLNNILATASSEKRRQLGTALVDSGIADEAVTKLNDENSEISYRALSLLFLIAKTGEARPLLWLIKHDESLEMRVALIKLLAASGVTDAVNALRDLLNDPSLAPEIRSAVIQCLSQTNC